MILSEPQPSPYDLRWRMFGVPVRVHWMFWIVSLMLTWNLGLHYGAIYLPLGVLAVFLSILIHEMGHVVMMRVFGARSHIVLHAFGGLAISNDRPRSTWKSILISFAGPLAQFILLGIIIAVVVILWETGAGPTRDRAYVLLGFLKMDSETPSGVVAIVDLLLYINLFWALLNLLPIWPLDGGQISRSLFEAASPDTGTVRSLQVSLVVSGFLAAVAGVNEFTGRVGNSPFKDIPVLGGLDLFHLIFFGMFAYTSWQALQMEQVRQRYDDDDDYPYRGRR